MRKATTIVLTLFLCASASWAHEFWLEPKKEQSRVRVDTRVGEGFDGILWAGAKDPNKIQKFEHYFAGGHAPVRNFRIEPRPGNNLVAFHNVNTYIQIPQQIFQKYLEEDGLDNALDYRAAHGLSEKPGREFYQRCVKTLVRQGPSGDATYAINTGMILELLPQSDPYEAPHELEFQVLFQQKPYVNGLVQVWHKAQGRLEVQKIRTDENGKIRFKVWREGEWMVSTVKMVPTKGKADWQSYWGSYTFQF